MRSTCSVNTDECSADRTVAGVGFCLTHYKRFGKYGDPAGNSHR
jgi:hypothetical protein